jgi:hypothetical protein
METSAPSLGRAYMAVDELIDKFNFDRVVKVMDALDWKWMIHSSNEFRRPNVEEMKIQIQVLFNSSIAYVDRIDRAVTSGGGFVATCKKLESGYQLELEFVAASTSIYT